MIQASTKTKLPADWEVVKFPEVVYFQEGPGLRNYQFRDEGVPFLNIQCLKENGTIDFEKIQYLDPIEVEKKYKHFLLETGDLVVSSSGTLGRIAEVRKEYLPLMLNTSVIRMRPKNNKVDRGFLRYFILSFHYQSQIVRMATGAAQLNYGPSHLKQMYFLLPPLEEQQKNVYILDTIQEAIGAQEKIIEKTKELKGTMMAKLFREGTRGEKLKKTEIGEIPESWEVKKLKVLVGIFDTKRVPLSDEERRNRKGQFPYCGANGVLDYIDDYIFDGEFILLAEDGGYWGPYEESAYLMSGKFWVNNHAHILQAKDGVAVNSYVKEYLNKADLNGFIGGTTRGKLTQGVMETIPIPYTSVPEQREIASILQTIDKKIEIVQKKKALYEELFRAMLEKLMTAEIRVKDVEFK